MTGIGTASGTQGVQTNAQETGLDQWVPTSAGVTPAAL